MEESRKFPEEARHLSAAEFAMLADSSDESETGRFRQHLDGCGECQRRMASYQSADEKLRILRSGRGARLQAGCPEPEIWYRVAAGVESDPSRDTALDHAASCDACGAFLRIAIEDLNSEQMPIEANSVLEGAFRSRIAGEMRGDRIAQIPLQFATRWRISPVWYGVAACLFAGFLLLWNLRSTRNSPEQLIAKAFEARRTWPVRFPGATYVREAPVTRAEARGTPELADAEALVARKIAGNASSPAWLQLQARVDFLNHRYDLAIQTLRQLAGDTAHYDAHLGDVYGDLGMAYLAKASADTNPADYQSSLQFLGMASRANPSDLVVLFNHALAEQSAFLFDGAARDWSEYLRRDSSSGWAEEARRHWDESRQKKTPYSLR